MIIYLSSTSEAGRIISSIFPLIIISGSMEILQVVFGGVINVLITDDFYLLYGRIAELVRQEFRGTIWKIYI